MDGDTIDLAGVRIRLFGIDAPEYGQSCGPVECGRAALDALASILSAGLVRCEPVSLDRYGRSLARCHAGRLDVNREIAAELPPRRHPPFPRSRSCRRVRETSSRTA